MFVSHPFGRQTEPSQRFWICWGMARQPSSPLQGKREFEDYKTAFMPWLHKTKKILFTKHLGKRLPFSSDPKYQGFKKYVLQSVERGEKIMDSIVPHLSLENKKILDIGCADGGVAVAFAKAGCQVTALDLNPDNIAMAKLRAQEENVSLNFLEQKAEEIDFPLHSFDGVIMNDFLEYTLDARLILKNRS